MACARSVMSVYRYTRHDKKDVRCEDSGDFCMTQGVRTGKLGRGKPS